MKIKSDLLPTPLQSAIVYGDFRRVQYLINNGADVFLKNSEGMTALDMATAMSEKKHNNAQRVKILNTLHKLAGE